MSTRSQDSSYDLQTIEMPVVSGAKLRLAVTLLEGPFRRLLIPRLLREAGISSFRTKSFDEPPTFLPVHHTGAPLSNAAAVPPHEWPASAAPPAAGFRFSTIHDYARAYRDNSLSPDAVAERVLQAIAESDQLNPPLRAVIAINRDDLLRQAEAATKRIRSGAALGIFDGVPVGVKDEVDMVPYPTTAGTAFLGRQPSTSDSTVVARFSAAGALLIGKLNMHEIGIGVTGLNPIHGTPRNPYAVDRHTGGSSSGSAAAVAAGLCPVAISADGGGSIRIPAALCGIIGLKPTFGRISEHGAIPICWSVAHIGPIGATATDTALGYAVMAGPDPKDHTSLRQPLPDLASFENSDLRGVTLGIFWPWFRHADEEIVTACEAMLSRLREKGAQVREIVIPDLEAARVAHVITICSEMAQAMDATYAQHGHEHGLDVRLGLSAARAFTALDYVRAQRVRTRLLANFQRAFAEVDAIITPATATVAPRIPEESLGTISDLSTVAALMRFVTPANLAGLPAISFPAGYTATGLPVGMQAIGRPWEESLLLRIARTAETCIERRAPERHFRILPS